MKDITVDVFEDSEFLIGKVYKTKMSTEFEFLIKEIILKPNGKINEFQGYYVEDGVLQTKYICPISPERLIPERIVVGKKKITACCGIDILN